MTAKTMAEVLEEHQDWTYLIARNAMVCAGRDCGWTKALTEDESFRDAYLAHQAAALSAAGFGLVADAKAEAWDEGWAARAWRDPVYRVPDTNPYRATP